MITTNDDFDGDPHRLWARQATRISRAIRRMYQAGMTDEAVEPLYDQMDEALDRIADTRAFEVAP